MEFNLLCYVVTPRALWCTFFSCHYLHSLRVKARATTLCNGVFFALPALSRMYCGCRYFFVLFHTKTSLRMKTACGKVCWISTESKSAQWRKRPQTHTNTLKKALCSSYGLSFNLSPGINRTPVWHTVTYEWTEQAECEDVHMHGIVLSVDCW